MKQAKKFVAILVLCTSTMLLLISMRPAIIDPKDLVGAWGYGPAELRTVMITTDKVFAVATYDVPGKKFISSLGGTWRIDGDKLVKKIEWNSKDTLQVGKEITEEMQVAKGKLVVAQRNERWDRLDDGKPGHLMGAWIFTGTFVNDTAVKRSSPFYPRRTMKILSGKHFHWIAYNVATKAFINAGGGTYTTVNGKYTENIEFFTKTAESVGKTLVFDYSFANGEWRHRGQKSTGGDTDECWSKRETLEK